MLIVLFVFEEISYYSTRLYYSCFFFQAEDGIRDLVRSRGLGDVYKRQAREQAFFFLFERSFNDDSLDDLISSAMLARDIKAVSYTHLTLPTSDLV